MDRQTAKETVKAYLGDYLSAKGINTRKAFRCLNPEHTDKSPSMSYDKRRHFCKCFSCGTNYDIFDLIGLDYGLTDQKEIFKKAYELYNITIDRTEPGKMKTEKKQKPTPEKELPGEDFTEYFIKTKGARSEAAAQEYIKKRGISEETAARFWLGYEPKYKTAEVTEDGNTRFAQWQVLIIPTGRSSYIARNIDANADKKNRYRKKGASLLFNRKALYNSAKPIFICEGELDALSIIEAGGEAVALGSTANYIKLVEACKDQAPAQPLIISLDADEEGQKTAEKLAEELAGLNIAHYICNPYLFYKDANEALVNDRDGFEAEIKTAEGIPGAEREAHEDATKDIYLQNTAAAHIDNLLNEIRAADKPAISTGFTKLDGLLEGGLYSGLYFVGAVSSLGKTSLCLQIADQIAQRGNDVLLFSLEMAKSEIIAKSISRTTFLQAEDKKNAKTTRGILAGYRYKHYTAVERALINKSIEIYKKYADNLFIFEGVGDIGTDKVKEIIAQHIAVRGKKPVVIIDYLQILSPADVRASDKANTDKAVLELKRASRDFDIPIIGISSFNRDNYTQPINLTAFKESGAIEYTSDVLIGLQLEGMDYQEGEKENDRQKRIRELIARSEEKGRRGQAQSLQLKILKNRNGSKGQQLFNFYSAFNYFEENDGFVNVPPNFNNPFEEIGKKA